MVRNGIARTTRVVFVAAGTTVAVWAGACYVWVYPRGVQDGQGVLMATVLALLMGALAGHFWRERGRLLLAVPAWAAAELIHAPLRGPTVEAPDFGRLASGSGYAWAALLLGRGVDLVVVLTPFCVGTFLPWVLRPEVFGSRRGERILRTLPVFAAGLSLIAGAILAVPAVTPARAGQLDTIQTVRVGGCEHRLLVRGTAGKPVLLFLSGGPGGTELGTLARRWRHVEDGFTVVVWDQTGAGQNGRCFPRNTRLTLADVFDHGVAVLAHLRDHFGRPIIVVANSWGTMLGVLLAQRRPDLVQAYVGSGQMVALAETDRIFYADTLAWAERDGHPEVAARLRRSGPPPYASVYDYEELFAHEGQWNAYPQDPAVAAAINPLANVMDRPELGPIERVRYPANIIDSFAQLYPQAQHIDLRRAAPELKMPVYLAQGTHEARGRQEPARAWFDALRAPHKEWVEFTSSGHKAFGEEPEAFAALLERAADDDRRR